MFTKITPISDSQLSANDIANLVLADAIEKVSKMADISEQQALQLFAEQIKHAHPNAAEMTTNKQTPLLEQSEYQFITSLFN